MLGVDLPRRAASEAVGTALLLAAVVGSGIMGERLSGGNVAVALLANALATGAALIAVILTFGPISGAHLNPAVTLVDAMQGGIVWRDVPVYVAAQIGGAFAGVGAADAMFGEPLFSASRHARSGAPQLLSEIIATFGLVAVILGVSRRRASATPFAVASYIVAAYWFTSSTSFANPAVTLARSATDTFAGIRPDDVPGFIVAQLLGAAAATLLFRWFAPQGSVAKRVLFACVHNAGRSQMAAALFNIYADPEKAVAVSAGTEPGEKVHPEVVTAMNELGVDLSKARPEKLTDKLATTVQVLVTMGCGEACPVVPGLERHDWPLEDPKGRPIERVREIRNEVRDRVRSFLSEKGWLHAAARDF